MDHAKASAAFAKDLRRMKRQWSTWADVRAYVQGLLPARHMNVGLIWRIAKGQKKAPRSWLVDLGYLTAIGTGRICPVHGVVHDKVCPTARKHKMPRDLLDWPRAKLATALRNRQETKL